MENLRRQYNDNVQKFKADFADCSDFLLKEAETGGRKCFFAVMDGLVDSLQLGQMIMGPVLGAQVKARTPGEQFRQLMRTCVQSVELKEAETFEDAYYYLMSGFCVFVLDGCPRAMVMGIQGWTKRSTDEPESESNVRGAKECFVESVNDNKALLRKRMKTHHLKLRQIQLGTAAPTPVVLAFLDDRAAAELVNAVEQRLKDAHLNTVADYGELVPFLDTNMRSFFSAVGTTERPDVSASKLYEGRVAVLVEGTPFDTLADGQPEGCVNGSVFGTYLHGLFDTGELTEKLTVFLCKQKGIAPEAAALVPMEQYRQQQFDLLADGVRGALDMAAVYRAMGMER